LNVKDFSDLSHSKELKLNKENKSLVQDRETAIHEAKHAAILLHYEYFIESLSINSNDDFSGSVISMIYEDEDEDLINQTEIDVCIAPYLNESEFQIENFNFNNIKASERYIKTSKHSDYRKLVNTIKEIESLKTEEDKTLFILESIKRTAAILEKYKNNILLITEYLIKHKFMDSDEITEQFSSDTLIESYHRNIVEIKLEKNSFQIERVESVGIFEYLIDHQIYEDAKHIFDTNYIDDLLKKDSSNKNIIFSEDKIV
jgi:hypothetical protein